MSDRRNYTYLVVTHNGGGVYGRDWETCSAARGAMERVAKSYPIPQVFEIERVEHPDEHSRRYQMRQGSRWVAWDPHRDHTVRKPDWTATSKGRLR